jgi:hypothetical protein
VRGQEILEPSPSSSRLSSSNLDAAASRKTTAESFALSSAVNGLSSPTQALRWLKKPSFPRCSSESSTRERGHVMASQNSDSPPSPAKGKSDTENPGEPLSQLPARPPLETETVDLLTKTPNRHQLQMAPQSAEAYAAWSRRMEELLQGINQHMKLAPFAGQKFEVPQEVPRFAALSELVEYLGPRPEICRCGCGRPSSNQGRPTICYRNQDTGGEHCIAYGFLEVYAMWSRYRNRVNAGADYWICWA